MMNSDVWHTVLAILASIGTAGAIILALSSWLGKVWAARIAESERAKHARELEHFRQQLSGLTHSQQDLLVRQRQVYSKVATTMRVFLSGGENTPEARKEFLAAYDEACLWASEAPIQSMGEFLDLMKQHTARPGTIPQETLAAAYGNCMTQMRRDAGFSTTAFEYRVVNF